MSSSRAAKNMALQLATGVYNGINNIGKGIKSAVSKRLDTQKNYDLDRERHEGNSYESVSDVDKRHNK